MLGSLQPGLFEVAFICGCIRIGQLVKPGVDLVQVIAADDRQLGREPALLELTAMLGQPGEAFVQVRGADGIVDDARPRQGQAITPGHLLGLEPGEHPLA
jgi:hypothetical protein